MEHRTVLLVEDDVKVRASVRDEFEQNAFHVLEAGNIDHALELLGKSRIDGIILDMKIADEAAGVRLLKAASHFGLAKASMPVIVFTGYELYPNCVAAMKAGAYDYIPKGIVGENTLRELVRRCRAAIDECQRPREPVDQDWLNRNYSKLSQSFGGRRIAVLPAKMAHYRNLSDLVEIDGYTVVASDTFEDLREKLMKNPTIRDQLPFMAFVPKEGGKQR